MENPPKLFPKSLITFTGEDFEMAEGNGVSNNDVEDKDSEPEASSSSSFDIETICHNGHVLANQYELVRTILSYLPMKDLENCGQVNHDSKFIRMTLSCCQVCQLWSKVKNICMKERRRYDSVSFYWSGKCADVSYYSKYDLFQSPHHKQVSNKIYHLYLA